MQKQVLPRFGDAPLRAITNSGVRQWVTDLLTSGLSAATTRKAVFALRQPSRGEQGVNVFSTAAEN
jgi:hypothetical protein